MGPRLRANTNAKVLTRFILFLSVIGAYFQFELSLKLDTSQQTEWHAGSVKRNTDLSVESTDVTFPSLPDLPTFAFKTFTFETMGYFNQQMAFSGAIMMLADHTKNFVINYQILAPSLVFLDYLGTNKSVQFSRLFDVPHWNSYFPSLPLIVSFHPEQHYQYNFTRNDIIPHLPEYKHPFWVSSSDLAFRSYYSYLETFRKHKQDAHPSNKSLHPVDELILTGALGPAPAVQAAINRITGNFSDYMAIHLRVEQDYLCHWAGVMDRNLAKLLTDIETSWGPEPPSRHVYFAINRPLLEDDSWQHPNPHPSIDICHAERADNLKGLNQAVKEGMWGGRVKALERPPFLDTEQEFRDRPVIFGSLIDSEICLHANVFIGRFSSTYTKNIIRRRSMSGVNRSYSAEGGLFREMYGKTWPEPVSGL